jgi:Leucine-rich repeat (LRR) protein
MAATEGVTEICLSKNCLRDFPKELARFGRVERLGLGSNQIGIIPDSIGELKALVWLDFTHNRIAHVSDRLGDLPRQHL